MIFSHYRQLDQMAWYASPVRAYLPADGCQTLRAFVYSTRATPNRHQYRAIVSLPNGLRSNQATGKPLRFRPELTGTADIITDNRRLLEQAFTGLRGLLSKNG